MDVYRAFINWSILPMLICCVFFTSAAQGTATVRLGSFGEEAGQLESPTGVAVDAVGDVYVGDSENRRVDKFDKNGRFLLAWGDGIVDGAHELQVCTAVTGCLRGRSEVPTADAFTFPTGVTVDNDPSSTSFGDVYVVDFSRARVDKFTPNGKFLLTFGGHINAATEGNACKVEEIANCRTEGTLGGANGEFSHWVSLGNFIAVGPNGAVYVGDTGRVQVFDSSGTWQKNVTLEGLSSGGQPAALAVGPSGDMFVADSGTEGVREFDSNGLETLNRLDIGSTSVTSLATDSSNDVYVGDSAGGFHVQEYESSGVEVSSFGRNTVGDFNGGLAFSGTTGELYATDASFGGPQASICVLAPLPPGPLIEGGSGIPGARGNATLEAVVNPEGHEISYHFEYVDQTHFQAAGYSAAVNTQAGSIDEASFDNHTVTAELKGLIPGETYHFRLIATNSLNQEATGADLSFEETPPALIDHAWATDVAAEGATLAARIVNVQQLNTSFSLEYGVSVPYEHVISGSLDEKEGSVLVSHHLQGLEPSTTYHYRFVVRNALGTVGGTDHTFSTQAANGNVALPDARRWEIVSPPIKGGVIELYARGMQAARDGNGVTYQTNGPVGEDPQGSSAGINQTLSQRTTSEWASLNISLGKSPQKEGEAALQESSYNLFDPDLTSAIAYAPLSTIYSPETLEGLRGTPYIRDNTSGTFTPLLTRSDTSPGTNLAPEGALGSEVLVADNTPDLHHVILTSSLALTEGAIPLTTHSGFSDANLYEWSEGRLKQVNILPSGAPANPNTEAPALLPGKTFRYTIVARALSNDGRRVAWTLGTAYGSAGELGYRGLFVRDMLSEKTVKLGGHHARFQTMSGDGSRVFFIERGDLFEYDMNTETRSDLTADHAASELNAGVQEDVSDVSEDGSYVYFVATGVLANGAVSGEDNLYMLHHSENGWSISYIATLSQQDEPTWGVHGNGYAPLETVSSRASPDGRYLAFMSQQSLTGYENLDAVTGQPDEEVYLYDALNQHLSCVSCDPTGARPLGVLDEFGRQILVDPQAGWRQTPHTLAASIPGWEQYGEDGSIYQTRYLSDSGRLFFDSPDALVSQATNGLDDVYEYEPAGVGDCTTTTQMYDERASGCVNLISSGTAASESGFMDASESGDDVFFITASRLTTADDDTANDVYDAHVCSPEAPCLAAPVSAPPCANGDSCRLAPSPQPAAFGPVTSETFSSVGNVGGKTTKHIIRHRTKHKRHVKRRRRRHGRAKRSRTTAIAIRGYKR